MSRQVWAVSSVSCLLVLVFYFSLDRSLPLQQRQITPTVNQAKNDKIDMREPKQAKENSLFHDWLIRGEKAQQAGNLASAVQCYTWALSYRQDIALEKRLAILRTKLSSKERLWLEASLLQRRGKYQRALDLYTQLDGKYAFPKLQTKIKFCRKLLQYERKFDQIMEKSEESITHGKWSKAIKQFQQAFALYETWPDSKKKSTKIIGKYQIAVKKLAALQRYLPKIREYLSNRQTIYALLYARQIPDLPSKGMVEQIEHVLNKEMARIPAGSFIMGSNRGDEDEAPMRRIELPEYYIDRREVSNEEYLLFVKSTGYRKPTFGNSFSALPNHPVSGVSWKDAAQYAKWVGKRLPSEAEWEKAARGTNGNIYPWGNIARFRYCNCLEIGIKHTTRVGKFAKGRSPFGCYDMAGNVSEWTVGLYKYYPGFDGLKMGRKRRVTRGGSRYNSIQDLRCSNRYPHSEDVRLFSIGFRCAFSEK